MSETWHKLVCDQAEAEPVKKDHAKQRTPKDGHGAKTGEEPDINMNAEEGQDRVEDSDQITDDESSSIDLDGSMGSDGRYWLDRDEIERCLEKKTKITQQLERMPKQKVQRLIGHSPEDEDLEWGKLEDPFLKSPLGGKYKDLKRYNYMRVIHLSLLRTCRQVYTETNQILWQTNIFSFNDAYSFSCFMNDRTNDQQSLITRLRLAMKFCQLQRVPTWSQTLAMPFMKFLTCLRILWLAINFRLHATSFERLENLGPLPPSALLELPYSEGLRDLAKLPLTKVTVSVTNKYLRDRDLYEDVYPGRKQWTQHQRNKYANFIRSQLLNGDGWSQAIATKEERGESITGAREATDREKV